MAMERSEIQTEAQGSQVSREYRQAVLHPDVRLMELAEHNPSLGGRELLREIIERGSHLEPHEPSSSRDLAAALRPRSLDDSDYRTPAEQAEQLHQASPLLRDLYERGATLKGDTLVIPAEAHELTEDRDTPFITTLEYAQRKLADREQAKEFYELARTISGEAADARTQLTVFKIYYDRLSRDERGQRLETTQLDERTQVATRTLHEMRALAAEMAQLETRESVEAALFQEQASAEHENAPSLSAVNLAARKIDLRVEALRFPAGLSYETKERLLTKTLPDLDHRLEHGVPRTELFRAIDRRMARPDAEVSREKLTEIGGFLKAYLDERLRDPETRALHTSLVFRAARAAIVNAATPEELGRAAEDFLRVNRQRSEALRLHLADADNHPPLARKPLDARERNLFFYGRAPEHHTAEMRELRIYYGLTKAERAERVAQLREGVLEPSPPLKQLLDELATRRTTKAISHFQASLLNEQMNYASRENLYRFGQSLPPHERTFLYELSEQRKQSLSRALLAEREPITAVEKETLSTTERSFGVVPRESASFREYLAAMGQLERQLLNEEARRQGRVTNSPPAELTITEARTLLPEQTRKEIRLRASKLAWESLAPEEVFERDPSPEAMRISETIATLQEQLQERARTAQTVREGFVLAPSPKTDLRFSPASRPIVGSQKLTALESYAAQTREALYRGFELLDEQRATFALQRADERGAETVREPSAPFSTSTQTRSDSVETNQEWHYDSLRDVLTARFSPSAENQQRAKEDQPHLQHEFEIDR